jgi:hypothetical protein
MWAFDRTPCGQNFRKSRSLLPTSCSYVLASVAVPESVLSLSAVDPSLEQARTPAGGRWKSHHLCLPITRPESTRGGRCRGRHAMPERVRKHHGTCPYAPCVHSPPPEPPCPGFSRHCPELVTEFPLSPVPTKGPSRCPEAAHPHRYQSLPFSLPLPLGIIRILGACSAAIRRKSAPIGDAAGARRRSQAATAVLLHRRRPLLPLR